MCIDDEVTLCSGLKCESCGEKPSFDLRDPTGENWTDEPQSLCERCGIEVYGENIVSDWAGTSLYLAKYPNLPSSGQ